jgi:hypothetical protein
MATPKLGPEGAPEAAMRTVEASPALSAAVEKRLAINLSERAYLDLKQCAEGTSRSMTDVIRMGIGLYKVAVEVVRENNKLVVVSATGKPLKEIVLPTL